MAYSASAFENPPKNRSSVAQEGEPRPVLPSGTTGSDLEGLSSIKDIWGRQAIYDKYLRHDSSTLTLSSAVVMTEVLDQLLQDGQVRNLL